MWRTHIHAVGWDAHTVEQYTGTYTSFPFVIDPNTVIWW